MEIEEGTTVANMISHRQWVASLQGVIPQQQEDAECVTHAQPHHLPHRHLASHCQEQEIGSQGTEDDCLIEGANQERCRTAEPRQKEIMIRPPFNPSGIEEYTQGDKKETAGVGKKRRRV
jgi:hypothetical protein